MRPWGAGIPLSLMPAGHPCGPTSISAALRYGNSLRKTGHLEEARVELDRVRALAPLSQPCSRLASW